MSEVAKCPKCGKSFDETYENAWCTKCGEPLPESIQTRLPKVIASLAASETKSTSPVEARPGSPVVNRYRDAYRVSASLVSLGNTIKVVGAVLAGIVALGALSSAGNQYGGGGVALSGILLAAVVGGLFWVCGVLVAAQGQIMSAGLDSAVHSSPFMDDGDKAEVMGLRRSTAGSRSAELRKGKLAEPER